MPTKMDTCFGLHLGSGIQPKDLFKMTKEILAIINCVKKIDLLNQDFLIRIDYQTAKHNLEKDGQISASEKIFVKWQAIPNIFDFKLYLLKDNQLSL